MHETTAQAAAPAPKPRRIRFGMRGLIGAILALGLFFGWLAHLRRQAVEREALVAELARERVILNSREPTQLCLVLSKLRGSQNILPETPEVFQRWLSPGWFSRPVGFNAGRRLKDDDVPRVVERLQRLGDVHEVQFPGSSLDGLRLFYIGKVRYASLGPERDTGTVKTYPAT